VTTVEPLSVLAACLTECVRDSEGQLWYVVGGKR
jgi:hypothetical protein